MNEQNLLEVLNTNENILENEDVTKQLDKLKQKSLDLQQKEEVQATQFNVIKDILQSYDKVVSKIVQVYFFVLSLSEVSYLYQFNTAIFNTIFLSAINSNENIELSHLDAKKYESRNDAILKYFVRKM